ncbi:MAG TPA: hypothetical protein VGQ26_10510 [Streptosporangiaceae bacterium]|nr:hypothetical protein [Streptosporangiaceae bacterium]
MAVPTIVLPEARNALSRAADRWADLLRSLPDTSATIPGSRWRVGEAAAHVVMDLRTEALVAAGEAVSWAQGATSAPGTPRGAGELNARAVTAEAERHPRALADMLVAAVGDFLAASAPLPPDHPMPSQYFQGAMALDLAGITGAELGEVLVHGYDIAKATGRPWPLAADDARLALRAALRLAPAYVNTDTARGHTGGYDLRIRGGPRVVHPLHRRARVARGAGWRAGQLPHPGRAGGAAPCPVRTHPSVGTDRQRPAAHVGPPAMAGPGLQATVPQPLTDNYRPTQLAPPCSNATF